MDIVVVYIQIHTHKWNIIQSLNNKNKEIPPFMTTWMDPEGYWVKKKKDKYCMISLKCVTLKKNSQKKRDGLAVTRGGGITERWSKGTNFPL